MCLSKPSKELEPLFYLICNVNKDQQRFGVDSVSYGYQIQLLQMGYQRSISVQFC